MAPLPSVRFMHIAIVRTAELAKKLSRFHTLHSLDPLKSGVDWQAGD